MDLSLSTSEPAMSPEDLISSYHQKPLRTNREGIDFEQISPSTVKPMNSNPISALTAAFDHLKLGPIDVQTPFLHGDVDQVVHVIQPKGFEDATDRACLLEEALYDFNQSPRVWSNKIATLFDIVSHEFLAKVFSNYMRDFVLISID